MGVFGQTPDVLINEVLNVHIVKFILQIPVAGGVGGSRGSNHSPPPLENWSALLNFPFCDYQSPNWCKVWWKS